MANTMSAYGSNTNRPLSEIVGLSTDTKPTDSIEGIKIQNGSSFRELDTGKRFLFDAENTTWYEVSSGGGGGGGSATLIEKSISANGVYNASEDSADGYSKVTVDVPNTYTAEDEGKVVDNGTLVAQTAMSSEVTENGTVDTTLYNSVTVNVPSGGGGEGFSLNIRCKPLSTKLNSASWTIKDWGGTTSITGLGIWTDGENIYFSYNGTNLVLNKSTSTWSTKTWMGMGNFSGEDVWTDGENIYYSTTTQQYILNKSTSTWSPKTWNGFTDLIGKNVWTDGENIYYSKSSNQYILDKATSTWSVKTWNGLSSFHGENIWTDGNNIYYSNSYVLDKSTSTWNTKTWNGSSIQYAGINNIWSDGNNIYYTRSSQTYILDKSTSTWNNKTWGGFTPENSSWIWSDGENIYYSQGSTKQYILDKNETNLLPLPLLITKLT